MRKSLLLINRYPTWTALEEYVANTILVNLSLTIPKNQNPLILCVINGDENIFTRELLVQGQQGGRAAAQHLTKAVAEYLVNEDVHIFGRLSFWITIFYNRLELTDILKSNNVCTTEQFDAFSSVCMQNISSQSDRLILLSRALAKLLVAF
jgi:hypothetical protein